MTSRERVLLALNHQQPDRCPIDLGSTAQTGMNVSTLYRFRKALGLDEHRLKLVEPFQMLGEIEEDLRKVVHSDVIGLWNRGNMMGSIQDNWKPFDLYDGTPAWMAGGIEYDINERGDLMAYVCGDRTCKYGYCMPKGGSFFDNLDHFDEEFDWDLDEDDLTPEADFRDDFKVATDEEARYWEEKSKELYDGTDYAVMGALGGAGFGDAAFIPGPTLRHPRGIRRYEDWLAAQAMFPGYVETVFGMQFEVMMKNLEIYKQAVGNRIQIISISGTDFGTQNGPFLSVDTFRKMFKPLYEKINGWVHDHTDWKTWYHSCGCINALLDDFAEMGVDCLNPVQFSAMEPKGLTPQLLKAKYGDRFVFWGGGVDTQHTLPFGSAEDVRSEVTERVRTLNQNGGFIFSSIHNVVANVPAENLIAMYEAVLDRKLV